MYIDVYRYVYMCVQVKCMLRIYIYVTHLKDFCVQKKKVHVCMHIYTFICVYVCACVCITLKPFNFPSVYS